MFTLILSYFHLKTIQPVSKNSMIYITYIINDYMLVLFFHKGKHRIMFQLTKIVQLSEFWLLIVKIEYSFFFQLLKTHFKSSLIYML